MAKNSNYFIISAKRCVPQEVAKTGTITTVGTKVKGTGTLFLSELSVGEWVYVTAQDAVRRIVSIQDDTFLHIDEAFTADVAVAIALKVVPVSTLTEIKLSVATNPAKIDGVAVAAGETPSWSKASKSQDGKNTIDPICVDPLTATVKCTTLQ